MSTRVHFVAQVGRVSAGDLTARPKIESICAKFGGKVVGGVGNSTDPIVAEFAEKPAAVQAAQEAWYLDDVEYAKVVGADANAAGGVVESKDGKDTPPVIESVDTAIDAVVAGTDAKTAAAALVEAKKGKKKDDDKDDDKKKGCDK